MRDPSELSTGAQGLTAKTFYGLVQFGERLALRSLASVSAFATWPVMEAVLYTHTQPPTAIFRTARSGSKSAESGRSTRETVRAWCSRTISYARCWRSVAKSQ